MLSILTLVYIPLMCVIFLVISAIIRPGLVLAIPFGNQLVRIGWSRFCQGTTFYLTLSNFFLSLYFLYNFDYKFYGFQFTSKWLAFNTEFRFGIDGISLCFILLTTLLIPICILISWESIKKSIVLYFSCFLFLEIFLILFFSTLNILFFYVSFESILIPMFLLIGIWGGPRRIIASNYFVLYTLTGSIFMLIGVIILWETTGTLDFINLLAYKFNTFEECTLWILFCIGFAVKIPICPVHLWLPEAHVEAPTAGSVVLAGLLLKLGGYGFIRICITFFPIATLDFNRHMSIFCSLSVVLASILSIVQLDLKKLVAYSSIAHMNLSLLALCTCTKLGLDGCIISMLSHGLVSSALFICVDVVYRRFGTRFISAYSGLANLMPNFSSFFFFFSLSNMGFPGTSSFVGEIVTLAAIALTHLGTALFVGTTVILSSVYSLALYSKVCFGPIKIKTSYPTDLTPTEFTSLFSLALLSLILGLYPQPVLDILDYSTTFIIELKAL